MAKGYYVAYDGEKWIWGIGRTPQTAKAIAVKTILSTG